jgi:hypothetical protein
MRIKNQPVRNFNTNERFYVNQGHEEIEVNDEDLLQQESDIGSEGNEENYH